jgi:hypothetical protein
MLCQTFLVLAASDPDQRSRVQTRLVERDRELGAVNPSVVEWRADTARAHLALGDRRRAAELAREELRLARAFGAPRAIGVALRACAAVEENGRLAHLREAAEMLRGS